ncbi:MAG: sulfotransferase family 2 domain-containing protein [Acidobacteriaceae bacterium]|nr:sulfotransferase family 2 domain-containing protein [Acidobacteriaceae bacterium]MBV9778779.1 sulfotransferase family 2 domain-containing protein [Acidobacteriaceae bacterium]
MQLLDYFPRLRSRSVLFAIAISSVALAAVCLFYMKEIVHSPYTVVAFGGLLAYALIASRRTGRDQKLKLAFYYLVGRRKTNGANTSKPDMLGRVDGIAGGEIYGWAFDRNNPSRAGKLNIYLDGELCSEVLAVHYRPDVGQHAFYFDLTRDGQAKSKARVEATFADGRLVPNSPLTAEIPRRDGPRQREAILFMHIAKTAGTAFREVMIENYKPSEVAYLYPDPPGFLAGHFEALPLEQRAKFRLVIGHFQYGVHAHLPQESTYVTIVRDPTERILSHYCYMLEMQPGLARHGSSRLSLAEMLERGMTVNLDNLMVRCFAGVDEKDVPPGRVDQRAYDLAVHHLKTRFSYVGYQDRADEAYAALQTKFSWKPRSSLAIVNRGTRPERCDEETRKVIERFNHWDRQLYTEIEKLFP